MVSEEKPDTQPSWGPNLQAAVAWLESQISQMRPQLSVERCGNPLISVISDLRGSAPAAIFAAPKPPPKPPVSPVMGSDLRNAF